MVNYRHIGLAGILNLSLLLFIVCYRAYMCRVECALAVNPAEEFKKLRKKLVLHLLMGLSVISDFPCYISFYETSDYTSRTYAWHRLQGMFLFMAMSMTINEWSVFLLDINELSKRQLFIRQCWLAVINFAYMVISVWSWFALIINNDLKAYVHSPLYEAGLIMQMGSMLLLMAMMWHAGFKLSNRLASVVKRPAATEAEASSGDEGFEDSDDEDAEDGGLDRDSYDDAGQNYDYSNNMRPTNDTDMGSLPSIKFGMSVREVPLGGGQARVRSGATTSTISAASSTGLLPGALRASRASRASGASTTNDEVYDDDDGDDYDMDSYFKECIFRLNMVVYITLLTTMSSLIYLIISLARGNTSDENEYLGPPMLDFAVHFWIPIWGPILAMLYVSMSTTKYDGASKGVSRDPNIHGGAEKGNTGGDRKTKWTLNWLKSLCDGGDDMRAEEDEDTFTKTLKKPLLKQDDIESSISPETLPAPPSPSTAPPSSSSSSSSSVVRPVPAQPSKSILSGGMEWIGTGEERRASDDDVSEVNTLQDMSFDINTLDMSLAGGGDPDDRFANSLSRGKVRLVFPGTANVDDVRPELESGRIDQSMVSDEGSV